MEDPANEVEGLVRALVDEPTLQRQAQTLRKFFTNDVEFYHFYINTNCGLRALIAIYQMSHLFLNYRYHYAAITLSSTPLISTSDPHINFRDAPDSANQG